MQVLLGLGGNVGDVPSAFAAARSRIERWARVEVASRLYRTRPVGPVSQPDFVNAALRVHADCDLGELLRRCLQLEAAAGRERSTETRWGPRSLDVDLLLVRDAVHRGPGLELPHPRLHQRPFALVPAAEVAPDWPHPLLGRTLHWLAGQAVSADPDAVGLAPDSSHWEC
jgi:2-amino-4-hydroxy-6-hydroxymethyldihydropteridine diphosphokinase